MVFFIRRYQKGVKNSGTNDILTSETQINTAMFLQLAEMTGPGKYILGERGPGIRGFRKITDTIITPTNELKVFAAEGEEVAAEEILEAETEEAVVESELESEFDAETISKASAVSETHQSEHKTTKKTPRISMKSSRSLESMSESELYETLDAMTNTRLEAENLAAFQSDMNNIMNELRSRGVLSNAEETKAAEDNDRVVIGAGFSPMKAFAIGAVAGIGIGVIGTMTYYKRQIDDVNVKMAELEASIREAETTIMAQDRRIQKSEEEKSKQESRKPKQKDP
ncbi:MAG: hypothetical protein KAR20_29000, partial [Candidatus Heimdallarchaeota archaeon]|nr:hypothetical protein [Candidatus Heimdallarchaeota archaeon]